MNGIAATPNGKTAILASNDEPATVQAFYKGKLSGKQTAVDMGTTKVLTVQDGGKTVSVTAGRNAGESKTTITLSVSGG